MLEHINESEFKSKVLESDKVVVVDFFATWCAPCKMLSPILEEIQEEMDNIKIVKIDVDENSDLANEYEIQSIPAIKIFKDGEVVESKVGFMPKDALKEIIEEVL